MDGSSNGTPKVIGRQACSTQPNFFRPSARRTHCLAGESHRRLARHSTPVTTATAVTTAGGRRRRPRASRELCWGDRASVFATERVLATLEGIQRRGLEICPMLAAAPGQKAPSELARRGWAARGSPETGRALFAINPLRAGRRRSGSGPMTEWPGSPRWRIRDSKFEGLEPTRREVVKTPLLRGLSPLPAPPLQPSLWPRPFP